MPRTTHVHAVVAKTKKRSPSFIERFIYVVAVAEPLAKLPQIYTILRYKSLWCFY